MPLFKEISWNQEVSNRKKKIQENETVSLDKNKWSKRGGKVWKKGKCIKIPLLKSKMAIYPIL